MARGLYSAGIQQSLSTAMGHSGPRRLETERGIILEILNDDETQPAPAALQGEDLADRLRQGLGRQTA
ncbi:hypothetical protein QFZ35_002072 [Arthrobacter ulcerisalmonis]|nr:hypothetical protein [Arthrobacter ulcerisalmonis]MDQ0663574.1 hypothetical protein [Arthrobacter ulcerisalmonis]